MFNVSGTNLTTGIAVTAPSSDFQVSLNNLDWSNTVTVAQTGGTVTSTTVYARFSPQTTGEKSGNITLVSANVTTVNVAVSGMGTIPSPVAVAATSVASNSFTANWASVSGASSYEIDVYTMVSGGNASDLIISEYVEGSSSNKAIEIFNGTGAAVDLSDYSLRKQVNGSGNYGSELVLSGTLENNSTYVIVGDQANQLLSTYGNFSTGSGAMTFNGNDAVAFYKEGTKIDEVGVFDQSSNWGADVTLRRKSAVNSPYGTYDPTQWDEFSTDTFNGLGSHTFDGGSSTSFIFQNENVGSVTSFEVTGLEDGTEYFYVVRAIFGTSESENSNVISVTTISNSTTWSGEAWSNGVPTIASDAIIAGDYNTSTNGTFTAKSLTVNSGIFTVASGTSVTVENAVTNSAGAANFIVENNANLIQTATVANSGAITVFRNSAPIVRLDHTLWSSPVASQNLYAFSPNTLTNRFYVYDTATDTYVTAGLSGTSTFAPGKGYGVRAPNNYQTAPALAWNGTFAGVPNNGDVPFAVSTAGTGFNLVGNPYPSTISATAFINANPSLNGTLYFYAHSLAMDANGNFPEGTNYATWNLTGSTVATTTATNSGVVPNGTIQVGQGFIVKATGTGAVTFANAMRTADTNNQFFRTANQFAADSEVEKHRLWLDLTNPEGTAFNQILIGYVAGATEGFDRGYDGLAFGNTGSYISTKIADSEYAIQARSLPFQASDVVPVSFKAETAGSYTISLSNRDGLFSGEQTVFLKDNSNNTLNNLKSGPYTFSATAGTFNNRFEVVYDSALGVAETTFNSNSIVAFKKNNILNVQSKNNEIASITAYDVQGRLIYTKSNINTNAIELSDLRVQNGVLLLQVTSVEGLAATIKVIY